MCDNWQKVDLWGTAQSKVRIGV